MSDQSEIRDRDGNVITVSVRRATKTTKASVKFVDRKPVFRIKFGESEGAVITIRKDETGEIYVRVTKYTDHTCRFLVEIHSGRELAYRTVDQFSTDMIFLLERYRDMIYDCVLLLTKAY